MTTAPGIMGLEFVVMEGEVAPFVWTAKPGSIIGFQPIGFLAVSVIGHTVLVGAAAITVATWTAASAKLGLFVRGSTRNERERPKD